MIDFWSFAMVKVPSFFLYAAAPLMGAISMVLLPLLQHLGQGRPFGRFDVQPNRIHFVLT